MHDRMPWWRLPWPPLRGSVACAGIATVKGTDMQDLPTDRLGLLLDQLDRAREIAHARLEGLASPASLPEGARLDPRRGSGPLSDEEYLWEPAPGAWSIRRRGEAASPRPFGPGEWLLDRAVGDPNPTPITTIAWRLGHLHVCFAGSLGALVLVDGVAHPATPSTTRKANWSTGELRMDRGIIHAKGPDGHDQLQDVPTKAGTKKRPVLDAETLRLIRELIRARCWASTATSSPARTGWPASCWLM